MILAVKITYSRFKVIPPDGPWVRLHEESENFDALVSLDIGGFRAIVLERSMQSR